MFPSYQIKNTEKTILKDETSVCTVQVKVSQIKIVCAQLQQLGTKVCICIYTNIKPLIGMVFLNHYGDGDGGFDGISRHLIIWMTCVCVYE